MAIALRGLERERIRRGLTLAQLSELSGVARSYISELESGKRKGGADVVNRLTAALAAIPIAVDIVSADEAMMRALRDLDG